MKVKAFLVISYIMSINKPSKIKIVWERGQFIGNNGIRKVMVR